MYKYPKQAYNKKVLIFPISSVGKISKYNITNLLHYIFILEM